MENRSEFRNVKLETRADSYENGKKLVVRGYPILFNVETEIRNSWGDTYKEEIAPEAVEVEMLREMFLFAHHDTSKVLGRSGVNVRFEKDETGVFMEAELPNTQEARDVYNLVDAGILDGMSFGFTVDSQEYSRSENKVRITKFGEIYEASIVSFPAYKEASVVAKREKEVNDLKAELDAEKQKRDLDLKIKKLEEM